MHRPGHLHHRELWSEHFLVAVQLVTLLEKFAVLGYVA